MHPDIRKFTGEPIFHLPLQNPKAHTRSCLHARNRSLSIVIHYSAFQDNSENLTLIRLVWSKGSKCANTLCLQQKCGEKRAENSEVLSNYRYLSPNIWSIHQDGIKSNCLDFRLKNLLPKEQKSWSYNKDHLKRIWNYSLKSQSLIIKSFIKPTYKCFYLKRASACSGLSDGAHR